MSTSDEAGVQAVDEARESFVDLLPMGPDIELRRMFGTLAALVDGHVFALVLGDQIGVKVGEAGRSELSRMPGSAPLLLGGRPMVSFPALPPGLDDDEVHAWLSRARDHVVAHPPQPRRRRR
ncbi:TfoX/Sxy family transcriptional regulator of competence genes [Terracoccus luteus]|uniref:TfoX/Sxy family transcriptional regulator of competence genes n=1 Tax=Terracoccus luteus TaxID=53356 RepID=A0A495Y2U6_9MICO|nr:TfoX/Sxy family protein [Terracoccus luteus]RKT79283.1 TfoX/Sxy family transcriptional regulator of competence genes [Terracoccus luteus]